MNAATYLPDLDNGSVRYSCNGITLTPRIAFGSTWLAESELREALGFSLPSHFRRVIEDARLYSGSVRTLIAEDSSGPPMRGFSVRGALQLALYVTTIRRGEGAHRAHALINTLREIQTPTFLGAFA